MTIIIQGLANLIIEHEGEEPSTHILNLLKKIVLPKQITRSIVVKYIRKAICNRSWYKLKLEEKVLLKLTSQVIVKVKSPVLKKILEDIFIKIELASIKGQALYYGLLIALKNRLFEIKNLLSNVKKILFIGISYLNNPPWYRVYG